MQKSGCTNRCPAWPKYRDAVESETEAGYLYAGMNSDLGGGLGKRGHHGLAIIFPSYMYIPVLTNQLPLRFLITRISYYDTGRAYCIVYRRSA
jgi:hypothetical protein